MNVDTSFAWIGLLLLGALHGINPGMGWLFAVALGLQEKARSAVWRALLPLAAGHALSIAVAVLLAGAIGLIVPLEVLKWFVAAVLVSFGIYKLVRSRHPRWGGMRVGALDLTIWSFLMATAHGAGLMVLPLFFGLASEEAGGGRSMIEHAHAAHLHPGAATGPLADAGIAQGPGLLLAGVGGEQLLIPAVTFLHTAGYLLATGLVAVIVYEKLGLRLLRSLWFNLDRVWAGALILTGILTPLA